MFTRRSLAQLFLSLTKLPILMVDIPFGYTSRGCTHNNIYYDHVKKVVFNRLHERERESKNIIYMKFIIFVFFQDSNKLFFQNIRQKNNLCLTTLYYNALEIITTCIKLNRELPPLRLSLEVVIMRVICGFNVLQKPPHLDKLGSLMILSTTKLGFDPSCIENIGVSSTFSYVGPKIQ